MSLYKVTFERIGRRRDLPPQVFAAKDADELAAKVYNFGRPYLMSRDVAMDLDMEQGRGEFLCGFRSGGTFTFVADDALTEDKELGA